MPKSNANSTNKPLLHKLLAISARELDNEDFADITAEDVISQGKARRNTPPNTAPHNSPPLT